MIMLSMFNEIVIILMMFVMPIGIPLSLLPFSLGPWILALGSWILGPGPLLLGPGTWLLALEY